jgi:hypothetical protein
MHVDDYGENVPSASLATNLFSTMATMLFMAFGAKFLDFCTAQQTAWTDPLSTLSDRPSLL